MSTLTRLENLGAYFFVALVSCGVLLYATACSDDSSSSTAESQQDVQKSLEPDSPSSDMVFVKAQGKSILLDKNLTAKFTYDFFIGKHEVTCGQYGEDCENDSLPQVDVTFYDAILFANRRSKELGYDTAYTYSSVTYDGSGHATLLRNFTFNPEAKAFRLPTESEWVMAAQGNFDVEHSWNADNSDYTVHAVCSAYSTRDASNGEDNVCDMAGNVAEWVYDWSHKTADTTVVNFVGPANPNNLEERILKGGNFRNNPEAISLTNRKDIYTVTPSTYADYVGFRLAFGQIPSPTWLGTLDTSSTQDTTSKDTAGTAISDSAGAYYKPGGSENAIMLRYKMELFWQYRNECKLLILGSSRSLYGINPMLMDSSLTAINMSHIPNSLFVSEFLLKNYALNHLKKLKYLVLSVDFDMWWRSESDSYDNFFLKEYKIYPGYVYDENHDFWKGGYPEGLLERTKESAGFGNLGETYLPNRGFVAEPEGSWEGNPSVDYDTTWVDKNPDLYKANLNKLTEIISMAKDREIKVIGIIFPQSPGYINTGSYSRYGPRRSQADSLVQEISGITKDYPNFILMDEHKAGYHDYADSLAANKDHLNEKGAQQLTSRLDSLIKALK